MTRYTVADIMAAGPCEDYHEARVRELWAGRESLTAREIAGLEIQAEDRLWALVRVCLDDRRRRLLACDCASEALSRIGSPDPRSLAAVEVARRYTRGDATDEELASAWAAAWDAASDAARAAASDATWAAASDAARDAASDAAWDATWAAARDAAWDAAWATARAAARATAWAAACDAARATASDAAWDRYLAWAVAYAEEETP